MSEKEKKGSVDPALIDDDESPTDDPVSNFHLEKQAEESASEGKEFQATAADFYSGLELPSTFERYSSILKRDIKLKVLSHKEMQAIYSLSTSAFGKRDAVEFDWLEAWEGWLKEDRGITVNGKFRPLLSYDEFKKLPWDLIEEIAGLVHTWSVGGQHKEQKKKISEE